MDWYPLYNSVRIALLSTVIIFFAGIAAAYYVARLPARSQGRARCGVHAAARAAAHGRGYLLLRVLGPRRAVGAWVLAHWGVKLTMTWYSAIFATAVVIFPLMYRTARGAFESFDENLADAGRTLGRSNAWVFWRVRMPCCRQGILAGTVLAFARGARRIRRDEHDRRLHARPHRDDLHDGLSALAHERRPAGVFLGRGQPRDLGGRAARGQSAGKARKGAAA